MRSASRLTVALVLIASVAGCAFNEPITCLCETVDPPPSQYATCPPNARCRFPDGASGNVIATLDDGRKVGVFVGLDPGDGVLTEGPRLLTPEPQPVPADG